jgi:hypothetical protein
VAGDTIENPIKWNFSVFRITVLARLNELLCTAQNVLIKEDNLLFLGVGSKKSRGMGADCITAC